MPSLIDLRRRIRSVQNTKKITRAMQMIASSKLNRLQDMLTQSSFYVNELRSMLATLLADPSLPTNGLLEKRNRVERILVFLITSDTGLCGSFNADILRRTKSFFSEISPDVRLSFVGIGKKGARFLRREGLSIEREMDIPRLSAVEDTIDEISDLAIRFYAERRADEIYFIYTFVETHATLRPKAERFLPFSNSSHIHQSMAHQNKGELPKYIFEPSAEDILREILPEVIEAEIGQFLKHSMIAEQLSRTIAMKQATDSAEDMIDSLTLIRNKVRQSAITTELTEVVSGARALQKD